MSKPQNPGWYWYNNGEDWEVVLVTRDRFLYARRLEGPVQSPLPLSCLTGKWGEKIKRGEG